MGLAEVMGGILRFKVRKIAPPGPYLTKPNPCVVCKQDGRLFTPITVHLTEFEWKGRHESEPTDRILGSDLPGSGDLLDPAPWVGPPQPDPLGQVEVGVGRVGDGEVVVPNLTLASTQRDSFGQDLTNFTTRLIGFWDQVKVSILFKDRVVQLVFKLDKF